MIEIADSWEGRDGGPTVTIPLSGIEPGDLLVVVAFAFGGSGVPSTPIDDAAFSNTYTLRRVSTVDATWEAAIAVFDAIVDTAPTSIEVSNSAGGANDVGAVVLRVTHNGTAWYHENYSTVSPDTGTAPEIDPGDPPSTDVLGTGIGYADNGAMLYIAGITHDGATTTIAPEAGWTEVAEEEDASGGVPYSVISRVFTETANVTHTWTLGAARDSYAVACGYTESIPEPFAGYVVTAPSPAVSGLTLESDLFGSDPATETFFVLVTPPPVGTVYVPTAENSEIVAVTGITGDVWDIVRGEAGTKAQPIAAGWWIWWDHILALEPIELLRWVHSAQLGILAETV